MTASHSPEVSATASELAARLGSYEAGLCALERDGFDAGRCRQLVHQLRDFGAATAALPQLAGDLMQVVIQHFELIRILCRPRPASERVPQAEQTALLLHQCETVRGVRRKCLRLAAPPRPARQGAASP